MNIYQSQVNSMTGALGPVSYVPWGSSTLYRPYSMSSQPLEYTRDGYVPPRDATAYENLIGNVGNGPGVGVAFGSRRIKSRKSRKNHKSRKSRKNRKSRKSHKSHKSHKNR